MGSTSRASSICHRFVTFAVLLALPLIGQATFLAPTAVAQNETEGDIEGDTEQEGSANSGDAVGGQVVGVTSSGDTSVDATNRSEDVDLETGDATGTNTADTFVGQDSSDEDFDLITINVCGNIAQDEAGSGIGIVAPIGNDIDCDNDADADASNEQGSDNSSDLAQAAEATTGDAVGGQVIGAVSTGTTDIVAANSSRDIDIETGDATTINDADVTVGLIADADSAALLTINICGNIDQDESGAGSAIIAPIGNDIECTNDNSADSSNEQTGDNTSDLTQAANATTGDGVGGQVIGAVSSGDTSIDATNSSDDVDIETGDATSTNDADVFVGLLAESEAGTLVAINICGNIVQDEEGAGFALIAPIGNDIECTNDNSADSSNEQTGDNASDLAQAANATSGDGVGGQVVGAVTSGTTDIVAANSSRDIDIETGDATSSNNADVTVGLEAATDSGALLAINICGNIVQDEVGAGSAVIAPIGNEIECTNDNSADASNEQDGDNDSDLAQAAAAATGDGVGGQVLGVVSSGDTSVDATNSSEDVDIETGDATSTNDADVAVGLLSEGEAGSLISANICGNILQDEAGDGDAIIISEDNEIECTNDNSADASNEQDGDNDSDLAQAADATTGDGVGGQVIGAVTSGSADIVAANSSEDIEIETGDANSSNDADVLSGLATQADADIVIALNICGNIVQDEEGDDDAVIAPEDNEVECEIEVEADASNEQTGDNDSDLSQTAGAASGDGVGGQVIGVVSAGDTSVDATNSSEDIDIETGDSDATNDADIFAGLGAGAESAAGLVVNVCGNTISDDEVIDPEDEETECEVEEDEEAANELVGESSSDVAQAADSSTGDAVGGQVIGVVTSAGGSADLVIANTSTEIDAETGDDDMNNDVVAFVGLLTEEEIEI